MGISYFESLVEEYLSNNDLEHLYVNHINKFKDYIKSVNKQDSILDINYNDLDKSVGYQNKLGNINTINSMMNHIECIKSFFTFLQKKRVHQNVFRDIPDYSEFKDNIAKKYNLTEEINRDALPLDILIDLLKSFETDKRFYMDDGGISNSQTLLKLFIKINLIAPAKKNVICNLKFSDFIDDFRRVYINSVLIKIPNSLRRDILLVLNCAKIQRNSAYADDDLFFNYICTHIKFQNTTLNTALYFALKYIGYNDLDKNKCESSRTFSIECIMNTALVELIENNTNPFLIAKINGTSLKSLQLKMEQLGVQVKNQNDLINNYIAKSDYYQYI